MEAVYKFLFAILISAALMVEEATAATQHVVGGSQGWDESTDFSTWASGQKFVVGDQLGTQFFFKGCLPQPCPSFGIVVFRSFCPCAQRKNREQVWKHSLGLLLCLGDNICTPLVAKYHSIICFGYAIWYKHPNCLGF